ncbi:MULTISPECIES: hypothetical protein [unclassified Cedecea]|uniref:hypothetical protein n=1 Tax=unclassified Cedecea TaxID=2649846 RepID=UPI0030164F20
MHKDFKFLKASIDQVCQSLKTEPLTSIDGISCFSAAFDAVSARLCFCIIPRPAKINTLSAGLWLTKMRVANRSGGHPVAISELERLVDLLGRVCSILKECWIYREWTSSRASMIVPILSVVPALLALCLVSWAGGPVPFCSVIVACFIGVTTGVNVRIKDPIGIFWSLYSYIPLYVMVCR